MCPLIMWIAASFYCHYAGIVDYTGLDVLVSHPAWLLEVNKGHSKHEMPAAAAGIAWNSALQKACFFFIHGRSAL